MNVFFQKGDFSFLCLAGTGSLIYLTMPLAGAGIHFCLDTKTNQKNQGGKLATLKMENATRKLQTPPSLR